MPHLSVVAFGICPRMTSFSDPRGNYYMNSEFHIKAEFP